VMRAADEIGPHHVDEGEEMFSGVGQPGKTIALFEKFEDPALVRRVEGRKLALELVKVDV
jgi:hypothetical protein